MWACSAGTPARNSQGSMSRRTSMGWVAVAAAAALASSWMQSHRPSLVVLLYCLVVVCVFGVGVREHLHRTT